MKRKGFELVKDKTQKLEWSNYKWRVNSEWKSKFPAELLGNNFNEVITNHWLSLWYWDELEAKYKINKEVVLCIAWADSSLWRALKTKYNYWNVGNNDRGDRVEFSSEKAWIEAIFAVLNNKYLKDKITIGSLSAWWWGSAPLYATSKENWNINVLNCLSFLYKREIKEDFNFRL